MIVNNKKTFHHVEKDYAFEPLQCVTTEEGRYYTTPDGVRYYSVTTVTGHKKKKFFAEWRKNNPDESKRVTVRGNYLHSIIEDYLNNKEELEPKGSEVLLFKQMISQLNNIDNIHALEVPLYSKLLKLAGRVDCIAEYNGVLSVIDFKGSSKEKRPSDIDNYFEQATAYAIMWKELTGETIGQIVVLISSEDGTVQEFVENPVNFVPSLRQTINDFRKSTQDDIVPQQG
jgi:genome maintenance exonuclease 1